MMVRVKMNEIDTELTEDEIKELEEAEDRPIVYDVDSPQMNSKMLNQFHAFDAVPIRVSREMIQKAKSYDKDYLGFFARLLETAFADKELVRKCI